MMYSDGTFSRTPRNVRKPDAREVGELLTQMSRQLDDGLKLSAPDLACDLVAQAELMTRVNLCRCSGIRDTDGNARLSESDISELDAIEETARTHAMMSINGLFGGGAVVEFNCDPRGAPICITQKQADHTAVIYIDGGDS